MNKNESTAASSPRGQGARRLLRSFAGLSLKTSAILAASALFAFAAVDQLSHLSETLNAVRLYLWAPAGSEIYLLASITALEVLVSAGLLQPRFRRTALCIGGALLVVMAILPIGNFFNMSAPACGARYSVIIRQAQWRDLLFLASTGGFLLSLVDRKTPRAQLEVEGRTLTTDAGL
jgi:hypothetical protein